MSSMNFAMTAVACICVGGAIGLLPQQGVPSQPGTPSAPPRPVAPDQAPRPAQPPAKDAPAVRQPVEERTPRTSASVRQRYFALQNPQMEAELRESAKRLALMETRMDRSSADLMRRLGEARQLSGSRQTTAVMEILQQILQDQAELRQYLTESRTMLTGDFETELALPTKEPAQAPNDPR